jgi:hypothetical protein
MIRIRRIIRAWTLDLPTGLTILLALPSPCTAHEIKR